jgi:hypothetical protein
MSEIKSFRSSRLKGAGAAALFAAFAFGGTAFLSTRPLLGWAIVLVCGGVALFALANLLAGGTALRVGRKGFEISTFLQCTRYRWDEIEPLQVAQIRRSRVIAVRYHPGHEKQGVSRALTGMDATVANIYSVPLQELCDTMNDRRSRYLAASPLGRTQPGQVPAAQDVQPAAAGASATDPGKPGRPFLLAFCAAFLVLVLNIVLRLVLKLGGTPVTLGIASAAGGLALIWFLKHLKRPPTPQERSRFLWTFSALIVMAFAGMFLLGAARHGFNPRACSSSRCMRWLIRPRPSSSCRRRGSRGCCRVLRA